MHCFDIFDDLDGALLPEIFVKFTYLLLSIEFATLFLVICLLIDYVELLKLRCRMIVESQV